MNTINAPMKADFDIDVGPDGATVSAEGSLGTAVKNNRGYGVSFEVGVQANAGVSTTTENGMTTYTANADASVTVSGGVQTPHVGANGGMTWGVRGEYTVAMPESEATPAAIAGANFYDPTSMPPGTTITVRGEDYTGSELNLTFEKIAVQSSVETSEGTGFIVQRLEDGTVQVMTGPIDGRDAGIGSHPRGDRRRELLRSHLNAARHHHHRARRRLHRQRTEPDVRENRRAKQRGDVRGHRLHRAAAGGRHGAGDDRPDR